MSKYHVMQHAHDKDEKSFVHNTIMGQKYAYLRLLQEQEVG
jgi:hypothetical protein